MEKNDTKQMMPIVGFDWSIRIPQGETQWIFVEEISSFVDGLPPSELFIMS